MKAREVKLSPEEAKAIGVRLRQTLRQHRRGHPESQDQQWLAEKIGISKAMVNRMLNHGHGSYAAWRKACVTMQASLDFVSFGLDPRQRADKDFQELLKANLELGKMADRLRRERDELLEQIPKLKMLG